MGVRNIVFGSKEERKYFKKLMNTWGDKLNIYHNLPFLNVFTGKETLIDSDNLTTFELDDHDYELLKKTISLRNLQQTGSANIMHRI